MCVCVCVCVCVWCNVTRIILRMRGAFLNTVFLGSQKLLRSDCFSHFSSSGHSPVGMKERIV